MPLINVEREQLHGGRVLRHCLFNGEAPMSYRYFIDQLGRSQAFRQEFNALLASASYNAFRFETPVLSSKTMDEAFEFVLINAPSLSGGTADAHTFAEHFSSQEPIVKFKSLGADATLLAPSPVTSITSDLSCYKHLASFVRSAPVTQIDALWKMVGNALQNNSGLLWFNTEGSGVAWLHIRLDTRPKYYGYSPYKVI